MTYGGKRYGRVIGQRRAGEAVITEIDYTGGSILRSHRHDRSYVSILAAGQYTELHDGLPHLCKPGTVLAHQSGEIHADYFLAPGRCINIEFSRDVAGSGDEWLNLLTSAAASLHPEWAAMLRASTLCRSSACTGAGEAPLWLKLLLRDFSWIEPVPLHRAAASAGIHPTHMVRAFRHHLGMTPGAYRRRERVRVASHLLLGSAASLSRVAQECGFHDQSHLTHCFVLASGMSPKRYRAVFAR
jgi:AraC family transcriptional regulator